MKISKHRIVFLCFVVGAMLCGATFRGACGQARADAQNPSRKSAARVLAAKVAVPLRKGKSVAPIRKPDVASPTDDILRKAGFPRRRRFASAFAEVFKFASGRARVYPFAQALSDEIDGLAVQSVINANPASCTLIFPAGSVWRTSQPIQSPTQAVTIFGNGSTMIQVAAGRNGWDHGQIEAPLYKRRFHGARFFHSLSGRPAASG